MTGLVFKMSVLVFKMSVLVFKMSVLVFKMSVLVFKMSIVYCCRELDIEFIVAVQLELWHPELFKVW